MGAMTMAVPAGEQARQVWHAPQRSVAEEFVSKLPPPPPIWGCQEWRNCWKYQEVTCTRPSAPAL